MTNDCLIKINFVDYVQLCDNIFLNSSRVNKCIEIDRPISNRILTMSSMSMSRVNRLPSTSQTAVTNTRQVRSEEGGVTRKECQPKLIKRRNNVSKSKRKAYQSQLQQQQTVNFFNPMKTAPRPPKWAGQFPAKETKEGKSNSDGELSTDEELENLAEQVYEFQVRVEQLHDIKDDVKWSIYRNIFMLMVMSIVYIIFGGHHSLPASVKEFMTKLFAEEFGTEYYYGSVILNVFRDMSAVISSHLMEGPDFHTHFKKWFP